MKEDHNLVAMEGSKLGGPWKESNVWRSIGKHLAWWPMERIQCLEVNGEAYCLVANGRNPMLGGQWGGILLGGQWKVPSLVAFGKRRKNILFTFFHFPPNKIYLIFFPIDFKVLFYHGFRPLFYIFPSFSLTYKLQSHISMF
jgi:hypothetical protein